MEFQVLHTKNLVLISLQGRLMGESDGLIINEQFHDLIGQGHRNFVLNLEALQHINSSGLGVLITLLTKVRKVEGELALAEPSEFINNLLVITKLNSIFKIYDSNDSAIQSLGA